MTWVDEEKFKEAERVRISSGLSPSPHSYQSPLTELENPVYLNKDEHFLLTQGCLKHCLRKLLSGLLLPMRLLKQKARQSDPEHRQDHE